VRILAALAATCLLTGCVADIDPAEPAPAAAKTRAPAPFPEPGDIGRGRVFAETHCGGCHAVGPAGASPYAPAPPFRTLHERYDVEGLAEALAEGILVGHKGEKQMPEFVLTPEEIDDLLAYLKSFEG
jgi:mono/diheme cytochrome c family protein